MADHRSHDGSVLKVPVASATVIDYGDLCYVDSSGELVVIASTSYWPIGISLGDSDDGDTDAVTVDVADGVKVFDMLLATAATLNVGDLVKYTSDKCIVKCTAKEYAIGEVAEDMAASGTAVRVRLFKKPPPQLVCWSPTLIGKPNEIAYTSFLETVTLQRVYMGVGLTGTAGSYTGQILDDNADVMTTDPTVAYNATQAQENPKLGVINTSLAEIAAGSKMGAYLSAVQTNGAYVSFNIWLEITGPVGW